MRKIFLVLCAFLALALGVSAVDNEFKNMLINIDVDKIGENAYRIDLLTQVPYADEVKIVKKSDYNYYILLAETYSKPISKKIGDISPLEVQLFPYVEQGLSNGYTKITLNTTRPLDFTVSLKAKGASKYPIMDLVKLAKLDQMFAQNQTTVKGGKVLVASAPAATAKTAPVTSSAVPAKPTAAATPSTPAKPAVTAASSTPATPISKPVVAAQTPTKASEPVRLPIEVKPLPKPIAPSGEMQSAPAYEPSAPVKTAQKPEAVTPVAKPLTAAPKAESKPAGQTVTPKAVPTQKAAAPAKVAQVPQKRAVSTRPAPSQPTAEQLYKPRKQAAHVPMAPPEGYEPPKPQTAQEPAVQQPVAQEPAPAPEPEQGVQQQEPEPIAATPYAQQELTLVERLALSFENAKNNNPALLIALFLTIGLVAITLLRIASVNSNNRKAAQLAAQQKAQAEQEAQRAKAAQQAAQTTQQRTPKRAQSAQTAQQMYTPPPIQPAAAPFIEPVVSQPEEAVPQEIEIEEIIIQVTPQDLAPETPPQAQHVEVVDLPPTEAAETEEVNLDDFEIFEVSFEERSEQVENYEPEAQSPEEVLTKEIVEQLAPQFDELPEFEADSEPVPQPVTLTFEDDFERPMGAASPSIEEPAPQESQESQEPEEEPREKAQEREPLRPAVSEPLSLSSRPPRRTLKSKRHADKADILSKVKVEKDRGFYLADYQGVKALIGYIMDDIFVINTFKDKELKSPRIDFRLSESTSDGDYYLVKVDGSTMLVKSQKDEMSLASIMKPY